MNPVYFDYHRVYVYLNSVRTNITSDVIDNITGNGWGIMDNKPLSRVGNTGSLEFDLNDFDGKYTPNSAAALSGWDKGCIVEIEFSFESKLYLLKFYIKKITPPSGVNEITTHVYCVDWMDYAHEQPIENPGILLNKRGNEVLDTTLGLMPIVPANTNFDTGAEIFPTSFDTTTSHTTAYDELVKAVMSELGYGYLYRDRFSGETLRFENATSRNGWRNLSKIPAAVSESGFLSKPDGGKLLKPDGGHILLNQTEEVILNNSFITIEASFGEHQINLFRSWANPRRVDTSAQILFQLNQPIAIASGQTITIKGTYADPSGGAAINGQNMITPAATTDYLVNTLEDGSGTNITASLSLISIDYGTEGFTHQVKNTSTSSGFVIKYNTRGYGIYVYNPIQNISKDQTSIDNYGTFSETLDQKYKVDLYAASIFGDMIVADEKNPRTVLNKISLCANYSPGNMMAFLNVKAGYLIHLVATKYNVDGDYYIQGMDEISISTGGLVFFKWVVKEALTMQSGLSPITVEFADDSVDAINYGYLPVVSNLTKFSWSAWVYLNAAPDPTESATIASIYGTSGIALMVIDTRNLRFYQDGIEIWLTPDNSIPLTAWTHVAFTRDVSASPHTPPVMYINGVAQTLTNPTDAASSVYTQTGMNFVIGNFNAVDNAYNRPWDGKIKDVRIYNYVLSSDNISSLYNSGTPLITSTPLDMVFQGPVVKTSELSSFINVSLSNKKLRDGVYGAVGNINGAPIGRSF